jgi:hypothetical protein
MSDETKVTPEVAAEAVVAEVAPVVASEVVAEATPATPEVAA